MSDQKRLRLRTLIEEKCIRVGNFTLNSGEKSNYYYDIKSILADGEALNLVGDIILEELSKFDPSPKSIGGLEVGSVPLVSAVTMRSYNVWTEGIKGFFVRKEVKTHGTQKKIEGNLEAPVVILDDVVTMGNSVKQAIDAVNAENLNVAGVISVIDREHPESLLQQYKTKYIPLFTHSDFKEFIKRKQQDARIHPV